MASDDNDEPAASSLMKALIFVESRLDEVDTELRREKARSKRLTDGNFAAIDALKKAKQDSFRCRKELDSFLSTLRKSLKSKEREFQVTSRPLPWDATEKIDWRQKFDAERSKVANLFAKVAAFEEFHRLRKEVAVTEEMITVNIDSMALTLTERAEIQENAKFFQLEGERLRGEIRKLKLQIHQFQLGRQKFECNLRAEFTKESETMKKEKEDAEALQKKKEAWFDRELCRKEAERLLQEKLLEASKASELAQLKANLEKEFTEKLRKQSNLMRKKQSEMETKWELEKAKMREGFDISEAERAQRFREHLEELDAMHNERQLQLKANVQATQEEFEQDKDVQMQRALHNQALKFTEQIEFLNRKLLKQEEGHNRMLRNQADAFSRAQDAATEQVRDELNEEFRLQDEEKIKLEQAALELEAQKLRVENEKQREISEILMRSRNDLNDLKLHYERKIVLLEKELVSSQLRNVSEEKSDGLLVSPTSPKIGGILSI